MKAEGLSPATFQKMRNFTQGTVAARRAATTFLAVISSASVIPILWVVMGILPPYWKFPNHANNFFIFYHSFPNLLRGNDLYAAHPGLYFDYFLYGPLFAALMGPFALLPPAFSALLFLAASTLLFLLAVQLLPLAVPAKNLILLICLIPFFNNQQHFQTNAFTAALILLAFSSALRGRYGLAALCISAGVLTKLYAGIGALFLAFAQKRFRAGLALVLVLGLLVVLPAVFSSFDFVLKSYAGWFAALQMKSQAVSQGGSGSFQGQSLPGFLQRAANLPKEYLLPVTGIGLILLLLPWLNFRAWNVRRFQFLALAAAMMFVVLFSPGAENPTYIVLQAGVAVWFVAGSGLSLRWRLPLLLAVIFLSSLVSSDLYPDAVKQIFVAYSLRAVPCAIVWFVVLWEMAACASGTDSGPDRPGRIDR